MRVQVPWLLALIGIPALGFVACGPNRPPLAELPGDNEGGEGGAVWFPTGGVLSGGGSAGAPGGAAGRAGHSEAGSPAVGGAAATAGEPGFAGAPSMGGSGTGGSACGNDALDPGEACDGALLDGATCDSLGFDAGELTCTDCELDTSGCSGTEDCFDARDNDGDSQVDCNDPDCADACSSLCAYAPTLTDPATVSGDTSGHTSATAASCRGAEGAGGAGPGLSGREVAYRIVPAQDGVLEASLLSDTAELTLSVRTDCESGPELACGLGRAVTVPVTQGDALYLLVDGVTVDDVGAFELTVATRSVVCGDGTIDSGEQCDDGGTVAGDGCDESCQVESSETNPQGNDTVPQADDFVEPFYGRISPAGDIDLVQVDIASGPATLHARTVGLGADVCVNGELDSYLEILDSGGAVLAENDDASSLCADVSAPGLDSGAYYVRVSAAATGSTPQFPYQLEVFIE